MPDWLDFGTCFEVDDPHIESALAPAATVADAPPREKVFALLDRMAEIAKPRQGAPRILFVIARLTSCDWVDGDLEVRLQARGEGTVIDLMVNDGMLRSHLRPSLALRVPSQEFEVALGRIADFLAPLQVFELVVGKEALLGVDAELDDIGPSDGDRPSPRSPVEPGALGVRASRLRSAASKRSQQVVIKGGAPSTASPMRADYPQDPALSAAVVAPQKQAPPKGPAMAIRPTSASPSPKKTLRREVAEIPKRPLRRSDRPAAPVEAPVKKQTPPVPPPPTPARPRRGPDPKATIRIAAVKIPEEAYRPDQKPRKLVQAPVHENPPPPPEDNKPTVRPPPDALPAEVWAEKPARQIVRPPLDSEPQPGPDTEEVDDAW
jgi:hypothetical protein